MLVGSALVITSYDADVKSVDTTEALKDSKWMKVSVTKNLKYIKIKYIYSNQTNLVCNMYI